MNLIIEKIKDILIELSPKWLILVLEKGLFKPFMLFIFVIVITPPLIVFLSAYYLNQLGNFDNKISRAFRESYLEMIYKGFSIEEVSSRSNSRLDYFLRFESDLSSKSNPYKVFSISILPGQKSAIDLELVKVLSNESNCSLQEGDFDIVQMFFGDQLIKNVSTDTSNLPITIHINKKWWEKNVESLDSNGTEQQLKFKLSDQAKQKLNCGFVHIEGGVRVFKDLFILNEGQSS